MSQTRFSLPLILSSLLLLLLFLPFRASAQEAEYYNLSLSTRYSLAGIGRYEAYIFRSGKKTHSAVETHYSVNGNKVKNRRLKANRQTEAAIQYLDSLLRLQSIHFQPPEGIADSMKLRTDQKQKYKLQDTDIEAFFNKGPLILNTGDIIQRAFNTIVTDGIPYTFRLELKKDNADTASYMFRGNFGDGVNDPVIKYWLPLYLTLHKFRLFTYVPEAHYYFGERNLEGILFRFIAWQK